MEKFTVSMALLSRAGNRTSTNTRALSVESCTYVRFNQTATRCTIPKAWARPISIIRSALFVASVSLPCVSQASVPIHQDVQAEYFNQMQGGYYSSTTDKDPGVSVRDLGDGDWMRFDSVSFLGGEYDSIAVVYRMAQWFGTNPAIRIRLDSRTASPLISFAATGQVIGGVFNSGTWEWGPQSANGGFFRLTAAIPRITGFHTVYITFEGTQDWLDFDKMVLAGTMRVTSADAKTYFVAPYGSNSGNDGLSIDKPFQTIQRAASVMKPGSVCRIRQGIYRETVRPLYTGLPGAPLTFEAFGGETAVISGAEPIAGWTRHSGSIYKAKMPWTLDKYHDQVIVDGKMAWVARCPNVTSPYEPHMYKSLGGVYNWSIYQQNMEPICLPTRIGLAPNDWGCTPSCDWPAGTPFHVRLAQEAADGALPSCMFGSTTDLLKGGLITLHNQWLSTGIITGSQLDGPGQLSIDAYNTSNMARNNYGAGWVSHVFGLLDSPNEWFRSEQDSMLYLWAPQGDDPSAHLVEAKKRLLAFDARGGKQYINLNGLSFIAATASFEDASHCIIEKCRFQYLCHFDTIGWWDVGPSYWSSPWNPAIGDAGVYISGHDNVIRDCEVSKSAGAGVVLAGVRNEITNCIVKECNYGATGAGGITLWRRHAYNYVDGHLEGYGMRVNHNTLKYNSRSNVYVGACYFATGHDDPGKLKVESNDFGASCYFVNEQGSLSGQNCEYAEVSRNWFHGVAGNSVGDIVMEIDMGARKWAVHHNVFWQGRFSSLECPTELVRGGFQILRGCSWTFDFNDTSAVCVNNTIVDSSMATHRDWESLVGVDGSPWPGRLVNKNNLYARCDTAPWKFTDPNRHDYTLRANSPAIDKGIVIPGWADSYSGTAPDLGAYEFGRERWIPGADWQEKPWNYPPPAVGSGAANPGYGIRLKTPQPRLGVLPGGLRIDAPRGVIWRIRVYDMKGAVCATRVLPNGGATVIPMERTASGVYVVRAESHDMRLIWKVLFKQRFHN